MNSKSKSVKPMKPPGFRKNLRNYFSEFTRNTGIHGLKYLGEQDRSLIEKLYWLFLFCISLAFCTSLILKAWTRWEQSPVSEISVQRSIPLWQIPFPAITVCPEIKLKKNKYNYTKNFHKAVDYIDDKSNMTKEEFKNFSYISLICPHLILFPANETTNFEVIDYLMKLAPPLNESFGGCSFKNSNQTCNDLFIPTLTENGMCYTFNMLDRSEIFTNAAHFNENYTSHARISNGWTLENGYPKKTPKDTFPERAMFMGSNSGMAVMLQAYEEDFDYLCQDYIQGFKIVLHNPNEIPRVKVQFLRANLNQEILIVIKPEMTTTSPDMRIYDPHRRNCFFSNERQLKFFQTYSQQNCQIECIANYTLAKCGCAAYYMPREESTQICGPGNLNCIYKTHEELFSKKVEFEISKSEQTKNENLFLSCDCLPCCTSITYNTEVSQSDFNLPEAFQIFKQNDSDFSKYHKSLLYFYFKDVQIISSRKEKLYELFDLTDFIAACGGILSLFTGFSFISIVEIFYFSSLRLICNIRKYGKHYWSGEENI